MPIGGLRPDGCRRIIAAGGFPVERTGPRPRLRGPRDRAASPGRAACGLVHVNATRLRTDETARPATIPAGRAHNRGDTKGVRLLRAAEPYLRQYARSARRRFVPV